MPRHKRAASPDTGFRSTPAAKKAAICTAPRAMNRRKSEVMAPQDLVRVIAIDIGSTGTRVCFRLTGHGSRIFRVDFGHGVNEERLNSPTKMTYRDTGGDGLDLVCGHELELLLREGQFSDAQVIHNMKLGFYEHEETKVFKRELEERLAGFGKSKQDLLDDYVAFLVRTATTSMKASYAHSTTTLDELDLVVIMTMPDMIDPLANRPLCEAAEKAGATAAYIAHESVCLTTSMFDEENENTYEGSEKMFKVGEPIAVADFGGAYACMTVQNVLPPGEDQSPGLQTVHSAISRPCGSKMIDDGFQQLLPHLREIAQDKDLNTVGALAHALGHSEANFKAIATESFVLRTKVPFRNSANVASYRTEVAKNSGLNWQIKYWEASLSRKQVRKLFDSVVDTAIDILKGCLVTNERVHDHEGPKKLIVSGGFARSPYFRERIESTMKDCGVQVWFGLADRNDAVCRGALLRYKNPNFSGYNKRFNLAVPRDEELDEALHSDALIGTDVTNDGEDEIIRKRWNRKLVSEGDYDKDTTWALERLNWIVRADDREGLQEYESWAVDYPPLTGPYRYESRLVFSESSNLRDHEPLYKADGETLQHHLKLFDVAPMIFEHPEEQGWKTTKHSDGSVTYEIAVCTRVFVSDAGWVIRRVVKPVDEIPDDDALAARHATQTEWRAADRKKVHDPKYSSVALGTS